MQTIKDLISLPFKVVLWLMGMAIRILGALLKAALVAGTTVLAFAGGLYLGLLIQKKETGAGSFYSPRR